jgi:hypothetical protein
MKQSRFSPRTGRQRFVAVVVVGSVLLLGRHLYLHGQEKSSFPDGYDALQVAPHSHKVIFEKRVCTGAGGYCAACGYDNTDASPPLAKLLPGLGYWRRVAAYSLPSPGRQCQGDPEPQGTSTRWQLERRLDGAGTNARY